MRKKEVRIQKALGIYEEPHGKEWKFWFIECGNFPWAIWVWIGDIGIFLDKDTGMLKLQWCSFKNFYCRTIARFKRR